MSAPPLYRQSVRRGALFLIASAAVFSFVGTLVKALTATLPLEMVVFARNGAGLLFLLPVVLADRRFTLRTAHLGNHALRAVSGVLAMYCFFYTIKHLHLAEAISLNFTSPLLIPLLAWAVLGERVVWRQGLLLAVGFLGALLIVKPGTGVFRPEALIGLASAFFAAYALVNIRKLTHTEPALRVVFYFALIGSLLTVVPMIRVWQTPGWREVAMMLAMGGLASVGQYLLTRGYAAAPAGQVGYYQYSAVVFAGVADVLVWGTLPDAGSVAGVVVICLVGVAMVRVAPRSIPPPGRAV
jgi:drug/metabolite transporter (DMT)-like permease